MWGFQNALHRPDQLPPVNPYTDAEKLLPAGKWFSESEAIRRLSPPEPKNGITVLEPFVFAQIDQGPDRTIAYGRLAVLTHHGLVQRRHNPASPQHPDCRLVTAKEAKQIIQRIREAKKADTQTYVDCYDADNQYHRVPASQVDNFYAEVVTEKKRRKAARLVQLQTQLDALKED